MRRSPSIVWEAADRDIYLVLDDFGRRRRETDEGDTDDQPWCGRCWRGNTVPLHG
jgi:hypothetical protein